MDSKKKQNLEATYERIIHVGLCIVPYEDLSDLTAPEMMLFGTTKDERVFSFSELDAMFKSQYEQMVGFVPSLDRKRLFTRFSNDGNNASITEEVTLTISSPEDVNTIFIRCSCVMEYIDNQWKLTHWHASTPVETENDHWHQEEWKREKEKLQKLVDKQTADLIGKNRDLEIETALERVRSRSMAMQKSEELADVVRQIKEEMMELGIDVNNTQIGTDFTSDPHDGFNDWVSVEGQRYLEKFHIPFINHPLTEKYYETLENDLGYFTVKYSKSQKNAYFKLLFEYSDFKYIPEERKNFILNTPGWVICGVILKNSSMQFARYNLKKFNQEEIDVFKRFGKVFEQAYTRFLDLQKVEAQAREAEIELALERVRARTMAMRSSDELAAASSLLFQQMEALGVHTYSSGFTIWDEKQGDLVSWMCNADGSMNPPFRMPIEEEVWHKQQYQSWKKQEDFIIKDLTGAEMKSYFRYLRSFPLLDEAFKISEAAGHPMPERQVHHVANFSYGNLLFITLGTIPEAHEIFKRFAKVFEQTYTRFLDLQKAEDQAREARIEAALERVRAKAMAMHNTSDLVNANSVVFDELNALGISPLRSGIGLVDAETRIGLMYATVSSDHGNNLLLIGEISLTNHHILESIYENVISKQFYHIELNGKELKEYYDILLESYGNLPKPKFSIKETQHGYFLPFEHGTFYAWTQEPFDKESLRTIERFVSVINLTYNRYFDLQKAEAQTREAQIEASLERVRAKAMSMQNSDELDEVLSVLCEQFDVLGILPMSTHMTVFNFDNNTFTFRETGKYGDRSFGEQTVALDAMDTWKDTVDKWKADKATAVNKLHFPKETLPAVWEVFQESFASMSEESRITADDYPDGIYHTAGKHPFGYIGMNQVRPATEEEEQIVIKFANEFGRAYQRFLDLKKAEAQAREAKIETALEKIRSRTMAMQKGEELQEVAVLLYKELIALGVTNFVSCGYVEINENINKQYVWITSPGGDNMGLFYLPLKGDATFDERYAAWKNQQTVFHQTVAGTVRSNHLEFAITTFNSKEAEEMVRSQFPDPTVFYCFNFSHGYLHIVSGSLLEKEEELLLARFTKVFEQTYTRFLDLQKAEAQAREATIENALEKVRSRSLAMHKSDELNEVVQVLFEKMTELQVPSTAVAIQTFTEGSKDMQVFVCGDVGTGIVINHYIMPYFDHPITNDYLEAHEKKLDFYVGNYSKKEKNSFYDVVLKLPELKDLPTEVRTMIRESGIYEVTMVPAEKSLLAVNDFHENPLSESQISILKRFSKVFDQAYTRFLDLQKAEKQTAEAVKQASLDRVRGEIASMRSVDDLENIIPLIWNELNTLGVPFIRCGVFIIHEVEEQVEVYLSKPDGTSLAVMHLPFASNKLATQTVESWRNKEVFTQRWSQQDFLDFGKGLIEQEQISDLKSYQGAEEAPESLHLHFIPFNQGMLYVGSTLSLKEEEIRLSESLAEAFSIAYARYEDFVKLEKAKASIEETLAELKATQSQLVQQEKLASLGQLTAGIAHEIKNPLNFVNNFSELSVELIEETREELSSLSNKLSAEDREKLEDALEILNDIEANLKTIHKHGTRADSIVKSMLQHSRGSSGAMAPTNLNAMIKEYSNLAFHGMRAGKNPINVTIQHELDSSIKKIPLIEEDFTRVLLNLFNNAFDAMRETEALRAPLLTVRSQKINQHISIEIEDNGPGIPDEIKDKIMQPFFTTKKGTEGTGLGLSITNDIIKAHGGELSIKSTSGSGSAFIISLKP